MIWQTVIFCVLLLIMWTIVILLVWQDGREKKKGTAMKDNDLISRSALLKILCNSCDGWCDNTECDCLNCKSDHRCDMVVDIAEAPAVDAVEVVRCKDCKHFRDWGDGNITCHLWTDEWDAATVPDAFCSYGERRADECS